MNGILLEAASARLCDLAARWANVPAAEPANAQIFVAYTSDVLDVSRTQSRRRDRWRW